MTTSSNAIQQSLNRFGLQDFRPGQREVVDAVLAGADCLCIMPTGGGKSLCFQLPSVLREGTTLVVSPLIALMKDQVDNLQQLGIAATFINSSLDLQEQSERIGMIRDGDGRSGLCGPRTFSQCAFCRSAAVHSRTASWPWTKPTASANGDTIFDRITLDWANSGGVLATRRRSR